MEKVTQASELSLADAVASLVSELPAPIREFIKSPERDEIAMRLSQKYSLHVDQAGVFQLAYLHMLIGVVSPEEFSKNLADAGIPADTVSNLIHDVNEEVFKPLRAKERGVSSPSPSFPAPPSPAKPNVIDATPGTPVPAPSAPQIPPPYAGARPQPLTPFNLPGTGAKPLDLFRSQTRAVAPEPIAEPVAPVQIPPVSPYLVPPTTPPSFVPQKPESLPPAPVTTSLPPIAKAPEVLSIPQAPSISLIQPEKPPIPVAPVALPTLAPAPHREGPTTAGGTLRTMATDMLAMNEHREPAPVAYKGSAYTPPVIMQAAPPPPEAPKRPPAIPTMPASLAEFAPSRTPLEPLAPASVPTIPTKTSVTPIPSNELVKGYATDPYREAI